MSDTSRRAPLLSLLALLAAGLAACGGGSSSGKSSDLAPGTIANNPGAPDEFKRFVVEDNEGGGAVELILERALWGRLVDVYDRDPVTGDSQPLFRDLLIGSAIVSDGVDYLLERFPGSSRERLTILHAFGTPEFQLAFEELELTLQQLEVKSFNSLPPFPLVPRNAAVALVFNDLLADGGDFGDVGWPGSVNPQNIQVRVGYPPNNNFELRIVPDRNHGDLVDGQFHSTRALLDMTVSNEESQQVGAPVNVIGLPAAVTDQQPNVAIRMPTRTNATVGQFEVLHNLTNHSLSLSANGPIDLNSPTLDVVRALRSGGKKAGTPDPFNGFLQDTIPPRLLSSQPAVVTDVVPVGGDEFLVDFTFSSPACAVAPRQGDVLVLSEHLLQVSMDAGAPNAGVVSDVPVRLVQGDPQTLIPTAAEFRTPYDPAAGQIPECFVVFSPQPLTQPATGVAPSASITVGFDETMDPASVNALETFRVVDPSVPATAPLRRQLVGEIVPNQQYTRFTFAPSLPFSHLTGAVETYNVVLSGGAKGLVDLAGNPVAHLPASLSFQIDPAAPTLATGGLTLRFNGPDEDGNGLPELRGQFVLNQVDGKLLARPVTRVTATMDPTSLASPVVQMMTPVTGGGFTEPLSRFGSRLQTVWRYIDMGFPLLDDSLLNIDVEGLAWMPFNNAVLSDNFPQFSMALAHSHFLPDEYINPGPPPMPQWPLSGLVVNFGSNLAEPLTVVHPKTSGYLVHPLDSFLAPTGTVMAPWPLNRGIPQSQYKLWTFRDTAKTFVGAPNGNGVEPDIATMAMGPNVYAADAVPTIGLPMLMEFRTYPASEPNAINAITLAAVNTFGVPFFRAHSTGGIDANQNTNFVQPDSEILAKGGFDSAGQPTPPVDNGFLYGQADFVVRVNRIHTIWLDTAGSPSSFAPAVFSPNSLALPSGTSIALAFRGATNVTNATGTAAATNSANYDPYGNSGLGATFAVTFLNADSGWKDQLSAVNGARFVQTRITMVSNVESGVSPELDALGIPFFK